MRPSTAQEWKLKLTYRGINKTRDYILDLMNKASHFQCTPDTESNKMMMIK